MKEAPCGAGLSSNVILAPLLVEHLPGGGSPPLSPLMAPKAATQE